MPDDDGRIGVAAAHVVRDGCHGEAHVGESEIVRDDGAPARGPKFDRRCHLFGGLQFREQCRARVRTIRSSFTRSIVAWHARRDQTGNAEIEKE